MWKYFLSLLHWFVKSAEGTIRKPLVGWFPWRVLDIVLLVLIQCITFGSTHSVFFGAWSWLLMSGVCAWIHTGLDHIVIKPYVGEKMKFSIWERSKFWIKQSMAIYYISFPLVLNMATSALWFIAQPVTKLSVTNEFYSFFISYI